MWIATVKNIDWPSSPGLSAQQQRAEMNTLLDLAVTLRLNAIILQVRPSADTLYRSKIEPWSEFLTGTQGRNPGYDPLAEWVSSAHCRNLELHAWFNPYRARHAEAKSPLAANHLGRTHPASVKSYGGYLWMDPGNPIARKQMLAAVRDVVERYDIDGVHIDDYFYPYPVTVPTTHQAKAKSAELDFPDNASWKRYLASGGRLSRADWRRKNVNDLVADLYRTVHQAKPWAKVGISPFGIGRPDRRPPGIIGFSQYDKLYADVELWLARGWLDYLVPQLYWSCVKTAQSFPTLLDYWLKQNPHRRCIWPGLNVNAINNTNQSRSVEEILRQVKLVRSRPAATGEVFYSATALLQNRKGIATRLQNEVYVEPALVPAMPWLSGCTPESPRLRLRANGLDLILPGDHSVTKIAVWRRRDGHWSFSTQPATWPRITLTADPQFGSVDAVVVSVVNRTGRESKRVFWWQDASAAAKNDPPDFHSEAAPVFNKPTVATEPSSVALLRLKYSLCRGDDTVLYCTW